MKRARTLLLSCLTSIRRKSPACSPNHDLLHVAGVGSEDRVLVIRRIHVALRLVAPEAVRDTAERVHGMYAMRCLLYRTPHGAIALTSSLTIADA